MLVVHHMQISQSERIVWLCEELGLEYKLVIHRRDPSVAPTSLKSVPGNDTGKSPFLEDPDAGITLSESGAILEYIIVRYGGGRFAVSPDSANYTAYLHWLHFANATLQPAMVCGMFIDLAEASSSNMVKQVSDQRVAAALKHLDSRLQENQWLAGVDFTAADIMTVYSLTTQRYFGPLVSLAPYVHVLRYLQDAAARPAYQTAMTKGDPEMKLLLGAEPPETSMIAVGGVTSNHWKKEVE